MKRSIYIFLILFFVSCSINKPYISSLSCKRVILELDNGRVTERLSLFVRFNDEDGINDYDSMTLFQKNTGLYWHINRSLSSFFRTDYEDKNSFIVGTNKIVYPLGKFPLGEYEVQVKDMQGNKVVRFFTIDDELKVSHLNATLKIEDGKWEVKVEDEVLFTRFYLLLLGADRQPVFLKTISVSSNSSISDSVESLKNEMPDARYIQLCAENAQRNKGYLAKPIQLY
jgi:putative lipoprotein